MYTLDTNPIIYYLKGDLKAKQLLEDIFSKALPVYISTITEVELFSLARLTPEEERDIEQFLQIVSIVILDSRIARIAGSVRKNYKLETADSVIAATALYTHSILVTRNIRDFKKIPTLKLLKV